MSSGSTIVGELFNAIGVKRVVYVDDRFGITRERIASLCRSLSAGKIAASNVFPGLDLTEEEAVREERLTKAIDDLKEDALQGAFDAIQAVLGDDRGEQDRQAARAFSEVLSVTADLKLLSLAEWQAQSKTIIAEVARTPTLFVFDDDFRLEGGKVDDGRRLIQQLHGELQEYKYAYALLTHNVTTESSEGDLEKAVAREYPGIADFVVVIAKARLTGAERKRFVHRLKSTLLFRLFRVLKNKLRDASIGAHKEALNKMESLGVDAFERIVYRSSREEGAWSPETLVRIVGVLHEKGVRSRLRGDQELHGAILEMDPLCTIKTGGVSADVKKIARELQREEVYDDDADLNTSHLPLEFGEIFQTDNGEQYVLVAQPCDLMVRKEGRRKSDARDARQMVALVSVGRAESDEGRQFNEYEFELLHYGEDVANVWFAQVNHAVYVPVWVLDLAVLNTDGACSIGRDQQAPPRLTLPWRKRLRILKERATRVVKLADSACAPPGANREELLQSLLRLPLRTPFSVKIEPPERQQGEPWRLCVGLRRVARLRERYAASLLTHYASYLSRLGLPHDLTRFS